MLDTLNQLILEGHNFAVIRKPKGNVFQWFSEDFGLNKDTLSFIPFHQDEANENIVLYSGKPQSKSHFTNHPIQLEHTSKDAYSSAFFKLHNLLTSKQLEKVVLSRIKKLDTSIADYNAYFEALCAAYPDAFCYLLNHAGRIWIGATPELLLKAKNDHVISNAVAGTRPVKSNEPWTQKEDAEHQYVVDYIASAFELNGALEKVSQRMEQAAGSVKHLVTEIEGKCGDTRALLNTLHPTPAVCGTPTESARQAILNAEEHNRALYTGYIHLVESDTDVSYVNLRCMQVIDNIPYLYVGGGLTADSELESEWDETEEKAKTLSTPLKNL